MVDETLVEPDSDKTEDRPPAPRNFGTFGALSYAWLGIQALIGGLLLAYQHEWRSLRVSVLLVVVFCACIFVYNIAVLAGCMWAGWAGSRSPQHRAGPIWKVTLASLAVNSAMVCSWSYAVYAWLVPVDRGVLSLPLLFWATGVTVLPLAFMHAGPENGCKTKMAYGGLYSFLSLLAADFAIPDLPERHVLVLAAGGIIYFAWAVLAAKSFLNEQLRIAHDGARP